MEVNPTCKSSKIQSSTKATPIILFSTSNKICVMPWGFPRSNIMNYIFDKSKNILKLPGKKLAHFLYYSYSTTSALIMSSKIRQTLYCIVPYIISKQLNFNHYLRI